MLLFTKVIDYKDILIHMKQLASLSSSQKKVKRDNVVSKHSFLHFIPKFETLCVE